MERAVWSAAFLLLFHVSFYYHHHSCVATQYNTSSGPDPTKLNVHLVSHTHDDVGWLKTMDQYYTGQNNTLAGAAVELILDTVITNLQDDPNRKFIYVEQAFFQRWWREQTPAKQAIVKTLVDNGQLEFINGGWCMHDEATTHYIDMIDQTTLGHRFIKEQFGKCPRIGWQIDPFGHSAAQAYLLSAELGFDALYFARIDYQDRQARRNATSLEFVWRGSKTLGSSAQIFTGVFLKDYSPPSGFEFETGQDTVVMQDDPLLFDYNVKASVDAFVAAAQEQAQFYRTNHIMFTMGDDFTYQNARSWFREMDKFVHHVNLDGRVNTFYSTPSIYTDSKFSSNITWPLKHDDFFPYADGPTAYWTGYFTSRAGLKGYVRMLSGYYLAARQLEFLVGKNASGANTDALGEALAVVQHHDGLSGTEKQHVANDYAKRLNMGASMTSNVVNTALTCLATSPTYSECKPEGVVFNQCPLLNISYCPASELDLLSGKTLVVIAYNSLGWNRTDVIRIPVNDMLLQVTDAHGNSVLAQLVPSIDNVSQAVTDFYTQAYLGVSPIINATSWLLFEASVPAFGYSSYFISTLAKGGVPESSIESPTGNGTVTIGSGDLQLTFSVATGQLTRMTNNKTGANLPVQQSYLWYSAYNGADGQASGAYIFRPDGSTPTPIAREVPFTITRGPLVDEVYQQFSPWVSQVVRVYKDKEHAEFEFMVGPIPFDDGVGKEVITRLTTSILSNGVFYTDSNGRDFIQRVRDQREDWTLQVTQPIAGNYYPVNLGMYIKDSTNEFSVLVDRAVGGSSIQDGQVELMLHRLLLNDDGRGVGEALAEQVCVNSSCEALLVKGKYYASVHLANNGSRWRRSFGQQIYSPLLLAFTTENTGSNSQLSLRTTFSAMAPGYTLPENVAMITLQELNDGSVLLRLAHLYEANEDPVLSSLATVDLHMLFPTQKVKNATEVNLSANQVKAEMRAPLAWQVEGAEEAAGQRGKPFNSSDLLVELAPMEIRTLLLYFQ